MACATLKRNLDLDGVQSPRPMKRHRRESMKTSPPITPSRDPSISPFTATKLSTESITTNVREEMQRLYHRKQLHFGNPNSAGDPPMSGATIASTSTTVIPTVENHGGSDSEGLKDKPLFTFKQVGLICERMVREREKELRETYEQQLATKLAEQYDTFVKFTFDQLQKRFEASATPSYLS